LADSKLIREHVPKAEDRESLLQGLFESAPLSLQIFQPDGHSLVANPALVKLFGRGPPPEYNVLQDEILERQGLLESIHRAFQGERMTMPPAWYDVHELRGIDNTGVTAGRVGIQATLLPILDRDGGPQAKYVVVWGKDVTADLELQLREERQRLAFAAARLVAMDTNLTKGVLRVSDNGKDVLGLRPDTPFATLDDFLVLIHPDDRVSLDSLEREQEDRGGPSDTQFRFVRPEDGVIIWIERRSRIWRDDVSGDVWRRGILMDVTDRIAREQALRLSEEALHRTESQLRQAQKLEAVGRLAGGIAHDFNNLLSVIISCSEFLINDHALSGGARSDVEAIRRAGEQAANLTRQLLAVSRRQVLAPRVLDLNEIVRAISEMLGRILGENIKLSVRTASEPTYVHVDAGQLEQVVMNLAINAKDAMPAGGRLTIETQHVVLDDAYAQSHFGVTPGSHVMLAVSDTGVGMDLETQNHLFEPFFTTKAKGKGTGLGLATVFGIVQQSRGSVWVYSELGQGSTFKIYLPLAQPSTEVPLAPRSPTTLQGDETVLIVEDQDEVRQVARDILQRYGYQVVTATKPSEAMALCETYQGTIHLLLSDVVMPEMSGRELAERIAPSRPEMRVLFMSGYTAEAIVQHDIFEPTFVYLQKPFAPEGLARSVRQALTSP